MISVGREENIQQFLKRITHLNLHSKGLKEIEGLEGCIKLQVRALHKRLRIPMCGFNIYLPSVVFFQVLYLYENQIEHIENLESATNTLTHLYLQRNKIKKIENMKFPKLSKL